MSATGRNILIFITGSAIGAGIGALLARGAESTAQQGPALNAQVSEDESITEKVSTVKDEAQSKVTETRESLRDRWERAQAAGDAAREAREAELRAYFREKVDDPTAFPPGAPTRTDG
ncbi:MAG TPA: hypothetical protein VHG52_11390 [Thermomicrobiales bacterium]|nr:hypothetical protein [Thermomicrobiales bacterium]